MTVLAPASLTMAPCVRPRTSHTQPQDDPVAGDVPRHLPAPGQRNAVARGTTVSRPSSSLLRNVLCAPPATRTSSTANLRGWPK